MIVILFGYKSHDSYICAVSMLTMGHGIWSFFFKLTLTLIWHLLYERTSLLCVVVVD